MRLCRTSLLLLACVWPYVDRAQWEVVPDPQPQPVFAGDTRKVSVVWRNRGDHALSGDVRWRLCQTTSATATTVELQTWKKVELLPGQRVLDSAAVNFPGVNGPTGFLIQWLTDTNRVIGKTQVVVYPTNLLGELKQLSGDQSLGVLDPDSVLSPVLRQNGVPFLNLGDRVLEDFTGKLVIIAPFRSCVPIRDGLAQTVQRLARKGIAVVWVQPPAESGDDITPSFYLVSAGKAGVVVAQAELVADFADNPRAQLNLLHFCKLALRPEPLSLPGLSAQP